MTNKTNIHENHRNHTNTFRETVLVERSIPLTAIIYPHDKPGYVELADDLAKIINQFCLSSVEKFSDQELIPERKKPLDKKYRNRSLILLGNITNNRVLLPLYARYYIFTDGGYPGGKGYDLRTIINPYGTGSNMILVGGSCLEGVSKGIQKIKQYILDSGINGNLTLPFIMDVELDPNIKKRLENYPLTPLSGEIEDGLTGLSSENFRAIGDYGVMYGITTDERYGKYALSCLQNINRMERNSYGDRHYHIEKTIMAIYWLKAGGLIGAEDRDRTDTLLVNTAIETQSSWWRRRDGNLPLGHRHHVKGTYGFLLLANYLKDHVVTDSQLFKICEQWITECRSYLDTLCMAGLDDQDDETTLDTLAILYLYALGEERYQFFESGQAYKVALRALALHDNMGAGAGQGGYGESYLGAMYIQQNATIAVAASALYYQDGQLKWIFENLPHLKEPLRDNIFNYCPAFMHNFDSGSELQETEPIDLVGIQRISVAPHQFKLSNTPPNHIEPLGHAVNAPETWQLANGIGLNTLPQAKGFDKITLRGAYQKNSPYLLLQGYQGGYNWQGHQRAANCIVRYSQFGHIFLIQNSRRQSSYYKNGVLVSRGAGNKPLAPIAAWNAMDDLDRIGITVTSLPEYNGATWTRFIFWSKPEAGFFVVIDDVNFREPGSYNLFCTWRTPGYAKLNGRRWRSDQGEFSFELVCADNVPSYVEEEIDQGACNPFVLRQHKNGFFDLGESQYFINLFFSRPNQTNTQLDLVPIDDRSTLITDQGSPLAWCGPLGGNKPIPVRNLWLDGLAGWISRKDVVLACGTAIAWNDFHIRSNHPVGMSIDFETSSLRITLDNPESLDAMIEVYQNNKVNRFEMRDNSLSIPLDINITSEFANAVWRSLLDLHHRDELSPAEPIKPNTQLALFEPVWRFDNDRTIAKRERDLRVTTDPLPLNGFPEQLVDTVIQEMRESWGQWPSDQEINIQISLPQPEFIDFIRILGDSQDDPLLGSYSSPPEHIELTIELDGKRNTSTQSFVDTDHNHTRLKRFRGQGDIISTYDIPIKQIIDSFQIKIPPRSQDNPLVLQEIEVYSGEKVSPRVTHFFTVDLFGNGRQQIICVTENKDVFVIDDDGKELWRQDIPDDVIHISCHDLHGDGYRYICLGLLGGELRILTPWGDLYKSILLANQILLQDVYFGWMHSVSEIQVWYRDSDGRAALVVGGYSLIVFLDPDFEILGHSWVDGPWIFNILTVPPGQSRNGDLWVRTGWNHGIFHYKCYDEMQPSGRSVNFGGVAQKMFRELYRAIPFANGYSVIFDWIQNHSNRYILAVAENGIGILDPQTDEWLWKSLGITPISKCLPSPLGNGSEIITAGLDGYVRSYRLEDGQEKLRYQLGLPATGLLFLPAQRAWAVSTHQELLIFDTAWEKQAVYPLSVRKMTNTGKEKIVILTNDGEIICFVPDIHVKKAR